MLRMVTQDTRLVRSVTTGIRRFADLMAKAFVRRAASHLLPGEELPPGVLVLLQRIVARMIEAARDRLVEAETALRESLRAEDRLRVRRDKEAADLYQALLNARQTYEAFGKGTSTLYLGLEPGIGAVGVQVLLRHSHEAVNVMSAPGFEPPSVADLSGSPLNPSEHVGAIRPRMEKLETTVDELEEQKRDTELARKVKTQEQERFKELFTYGSRFHEALYVLAGEKYHSARLRPKVGRVGSAEAEEPVILEGDVVEGEGVPPPATEPPTEEATDLSVEASSQASPEADSPSD